MYPAGPAPWSDGSFDRRASPDLICFSRPLVAHFPSVEHKAFNLMRLSRSVVGKIGSSKPVGTERLSEYEGKVNSYYLTPDIDIRTLTDTLVKKGFLGDKFLRGEQSETNQICPLSQPLPTFG